MYICKYCGNKTEFEEVNVVKTYINQDKNIKENHKYIFNDEFFYREDVVCLNCGNNMDDGWVEEISY